LETGETDQEITDELREGKTRTHLNTFAIRTELLRKLQGCRPYFVTAEDLDLQLRLGGVARVWYQANRAYEYRLHDASTIHNQANVQRLFYERTAREFLVQRRNNSMDDLQRGCPPIPPSSDGKPFSAAIQKQGILVGEAWRQHGEGRKCQAIKTGWRACWVRPIHWPAWKSLVALIVKR
jgi:hypothetical protein